ncbi:MAG: hypothetical protein JSR46_03910 [Verrucomicrobia bacterium]|nr:hypothetical protein [Verrucomicrobiota bacterium]
MNVQTIPTQTNHVHLKEVEQTIGKQLDALKDVKINSINSETRNTAILQNSIQALKTSIQTEPAPLEHPLTTLWNSVCTVFNRVVSALFDPETYDIGKLFTSRKVLEEQKLSQLLTQLKYRQQISPKLQLEFQQKFAEDKLDTTYTDILSLIGQLNAPGPVYEQLIALLRENNIYAILRYIHDEALLSSLKASTEWHEIGNESERAQVASATITPEDTFEATQLHKLLSSLSSRLKIKQTIDKQLQNPIYDSIREVLAPLQSQTSKALSNSDPGTFSKSYLNLLATLSEAHREISLERCSLAELQAFLQTNPAPATLFQKLSLQFSQEDFLNTWIGRVNKLHHKFTQIKEVTEEEVEHLLTLTSQLYQHYGKLLESEGKGQICETQYSAQYGTILAGWRKINKLFHSLGHANAHTVCSCHYVHPIDAKDAGVWKGLPSRVDGLKSICEVPKFQENKEEKTVLFLFAQYGGGHRSAADAVMGYSQIAKNDYNYHVRSINASLDVMLKTDPVHNLFGSMFEGVNKPWVYNTLVRHEMANVLEFLIKLVGSGEPTLEEKNQVKNYFRQAILKEKPDLLVMTYREDNESIVEVAEELGIPLLHVACDFDASGWRQEITHPAFKMTLPVSTRDSKILKSTGKFIREDQLAYIGPCVRLPFEETLDVARIRQERGIAPNEKVVLFSSGGNGVPSTLPALLAKEWDDPETPIRIIVVTGENTAYAEDLTANLQPTLEGSDRIKLDILPRIDATEMAALIQIADTVVGKPGGLTTFEAYKTGTPFLGDQLNHRFEWELFNNEFLVDLKQGDKLEKQEDFIPKLKMLFKQPKIPITDSSSEKYVALMTELIQTGEKSELLQSNRTNWEPTQMVEAY